MRPLMRIGSRLDAGRAGGYGAPGHTSFFRSVYCRDAAHDLRDLDRRSTRRGVEEPPRVTNGETFTPFGHVSGVGVRRTDSSRHAWSRPTVTTSES